MTRRKAIYLDEYGHSQPIPAACRLGNTLVSGIIHGLDPKLPGGGSLEVQAALMFRRIGEVILLHFADGILQDGKIDTRTLDPLCRLAGPHYASLGEILTLPPIGQPAK